MFKERAGTMPVNFAIAYFLLTLEQSPGDAKDKAETCRRYCNPRDRVKENGISSV